MLHPDRTLSLSKGTTSGTSTSSVSDLIRQIWDNRNTIYNYDQFSFTNELLQDAIERGWQNKKKIKLAKVSTQFGEPDYLTLHYFELNVFRFSAAKTAQMVHELNKLAKDSDTFNDFRKKAEIHSKLYNENYLRTEYDFAWNASHNAAQYHRQKAQSKNFKIVIYKTAGDDRVRQAHDELSGMKFSIDDPILDIIYPPNGHGCRCYFKSGRSGKVSKGEDAIKILQNSGIDKNGVSEWDRMKKGGFDKNRAITGQIFDLNKTYIKADIGSKLSWKDQGLNNYKDMNQSDFPSLKTKPQTKEEALQWALKKDIVEDYLERKIKLHPKSVKNHLKKPGRADLIELIPEILQNPNEVYLFDDSNGRNMLRYIKYYNGKVLNVVAQLREDGMQVMSWHEITKNLSNEKRVGILIKKL